MRIVLAAIVIASACQAVHAQKTPQALELVGKATDFDFTRNWATYYWREDFTFMLKDEKSGKDWRILSREPTPAYDWKMGTTFSGLKPDWTKSPRVKIIGVTGVDRLPAKYYNLKLDEPNIATAHLVYVEVNKEWKLYNANNWFHKWSEQADPVIHSHFANKDAPYDIYGFINGQTAPFSAKSQALIGQHKSARMFHGVIRTAKNPFGYEIEVLHLVGPDKGGNGVVFHGEPKTLIPLDKKK